MSAGDAFAQATSPNRIVGVWEAEDGILKIEEFDAGGGYSGRMIYGKLLVEADGKTFKKDIFNPDPQTKSRSLEGIVLLTSGIRGIVAGRTAVGTVAPTAALYVPAPLWWTECSGCRPILMRNLLVE